MTLITIALSIFSALILGCLALFALARLWVMVLARDRLQGSDLHMLKWCLQEQTRAWAGFHITLAEDAPYEELKREVIKNISDEMNSPTSDYRRGLDLSTAQYIYHETYTASDLIFETEDAAFFRLSDDHNRELLYKFHDGRHLIGALFDHTVWDGIRMFNETLAPAIKSKHPLT